MSIVTDGPDYSIKFRISIDIYTESQIYHVQIQIIGDLVIYMTGQVLARLKYWRLQPANVMSRLWIVRFRPDYFILAIT